MEVAGLAWEEPEGGGVAAREKRYLDAERRRLVYVAATRARDLLVLPVAGDPNPGWITGRLVSGAPAERMETRARYACGEEPAWAKEVAAPAPRPRGDASALAGDVARAWRAAAEEAAHPRFAPAAVTAAAHAAAGELERPGEAGAARPERRSRFGRVFGDTVHLAIGLALRDPDLAPPAAAARAAAATGLAEHLADAGEDVARALAALEAAGLRRPPGPDLRLEYPLAQPRGGRLLVGYVDLLAADARGLAVVDFKTDAPPGGDVAATHPAYVEQVRSYARMLEDLGLAPAGTARAGLLFTAEREIRWIAR
jgi:ATP-dependent helicase/nuclease subunit A